MRKIAAVLGIIVIFCTACGKVDSQSIHMRIQQMKR